MNSWIPSMGVAALLAVGLAAGALAQDVVEARQDSMSAIGDAMKPLRPMFSGEATYDPATVRASADIVAEHAGAPLIALFPEGSRNPDSAALPAIWENWAEFEALANKLGVVAKGLALAADNTEAAAPSGGASMGALMGAAPAPAPDAALTAEALGEKPAAEVFKMVGDTCGSCHSQFREKRS
ncbi:c-type cytochrome [Acuticoccus kandeliae]|uniref:c-type cytochrome n=1 Tax=Acuticoccus kandeliae TaxID=2073160 RepID=UPI000D3EA7C7|nr:cytochrome c [Acuticoccus kandeliae]